MFSDYSERSVKSTLGRMCFEADLENFAGKIAIRTHIRRHFAEKYADKSELAGAREVASFKPLKSLPWAQHLDKLRDWGYKNGSTDYRVIAGYQS